MKSKKGAISFVVGLGLLLAYWYHLHPMDFARGYTEDWCGADMTRQMMADSIAETGGPAFHTSHYLAPYGATLPFMSWGMEMSWLGAYFWKWGREFPFQWFQFGLSLLGSYLGVGWILRKMKLSPLAAWGMATSVVLFHIPRHFKTWHHFEHMLQHWVYWGFFLDAWIWQRFVRERKWSLSLEAWRGLCLMGMLTTAGYFWGPQILEWSLVRLCIAGLWIIRSKRGSEPVKIDGAWSQALPAVLLGLILVGFDLRWYLPLAQAAKPFGEIPQNLGWFGHWPYIVRPLWLDDLFQFLRDTTGMYIVKRPYTSPETVVTPGWFLLIPVLVGLFQVEKLRRKASGLLVALPFLILFGVAVLYLDQDPPVMASVIQRVVPFMKYFRVAVRWGLLFPELLGVMIVLCWPELSAWVRGTFKNSPRKAWVLVAIFGISSLGEFAQLRVPFSTMPALANSAVQLLEGVKNAPGTTVLDLPFCLAGGNGICSSEQCPNYPGATTAECFRGWHDKNVYGIYAARLAPEQCAFYHQAPYLSWFDAWRTQRCFTESEWTDFCSYLDGHSELSAVLLYPDVWSGAGTSQCLSQFSRYLGEPIAQAEYVGKAVHGNEVPQFARLFRYGTHCRR